LEIRTRGSDLGDQKQVGSDDYADALDSSIFVISRARIEPERQLARKTYSRRFWAIPCVAFVAHAPRLAQWRLLYRTCPPSPIFGERRARACRVHNQRASRFDSTRR